MIIETFVTELNESFSMYGLTSFSGGTKTNNKLALISPSSKLKFNLKKDVYNNKEGLELGEVHTKTSFSTTRDNVLNFSILCTRKNKTVGEKIKMSQEIIDNIHVLGLQNYTNYERMNPIGVSLDWNDIIERLAKYKKFKYRFLIENLLFSSNLESDTDVIFVTCDGLSDDKEALINSKIHKVLGVVYISEIENWNLLKSETKRSQAVFEDSEYHTKSSHFSFAYNKKLI